MNTPISAFMQGVVQVFRRTFTLKYPYEKKALAPGFRGRHLLYLDRCTGCGICAWICPEKCITFVPLKGDKVYPQNPENRFPQYWYARCCFCHLCVTPETLVATNPSVRPVADVSIGERVLTHAGQYRKVREVYKREYTGPLYSIRPLGAPFPLRVTEDHPLLVSTRRIIKKGRLEKGIRELSWKKPQELKAGDYLTIPIIKETRDVEFVEQDIEIGQPSTGKRLLRKLRLRADKDLFRLIGYYLAEGHVNRRTVGFTFGAHEKHYIIDVGRLLRKVFKHRTKRLAFPSAIQIIIHSVAAVQFFASFGKGAANKSLPDWIVFSPPEKQRELIRGAWRGDGYLHLPTKGNPATYFEYVTTSRGLAFQLQQLLMRNGIVGEISYTQHRNRKPAYILAVRGRFVGPMARLMGIRFRDKRTKTFSKFEMDGNYVYAPIRSISSELVVNQPVVNLSVEGDESYVAGNVTAHNCTDYCPTGALDYTPEYELAEYDRELAIWSPERLAQPPEKQKVYDTKISAMLGTTHAPKEEQA